MEFPDNSPVLLSSFFPDSRCDQIILVNELMSDTNHRPNKCLVPSTSKPVSSYKVNVTDTWLVDVCHRILLLGKLKRGPTRETRPESHLDHRRVESQSSTEVPDPRPEDPQRA